MPKEELNAEDGSGYADLPDLRSASDSEDEMRVVCDVSAILSTTTVSDELTNAVAEVVQQPASTVAVCDEKDSWVLVDEHEGSMCCDGCGQSEIPCQRCLQCMSVQYCCKACQRSHWKETHRHSCARLGPALQKIAFRPTGEVLTMSPLCSKADSSVQPEGCPRVGHFEHKLPEAATAWIRKVGATPFNMAVFCKHLCAQFGLNHVKLLCDKFLKTAEDGEMEEYTIRSILAGTGIELCTFLYMVNAMKLPKNLPHVPTFDDTLNMHLASLCGPRATLPLTHALFAQLVMIQRTDGSVFYPGTISLALGNKEPWLMMERFARELLKTKKGKKEDQPVFGLFTLTKSELWNELKEKTSYYSQWLIARKSSDSRGNNGRYLGLGDDGPCYRTLPEWRTFLVDGIARETEHAAEEFPDDMWRLFDFEETGLNFDQAFV